MKGHKSHISAISASVKPSAA